MNLPALSIKRPIALLMIVFVVLILGGVSFSRLSMDLLPNMSFPVAAVITNYQGVGPQEIESMVTKPLEEVLGTVNNVRSIRSISRAGTSTVIVEFNWGTDMDFATLQMREKVDLIKRVLPSDIETPTVFKFDPSLMPIMVLGVSGGYDPATLKTIIEEKVKNRLERLDGVASVEINGGLTREIRVNANPERLQGYGLTLTQLVQALQAENMNLPGGVIQKGNQELLVRTTGEFKSVDEIGNILITSPQGVFVRLKDVAEVKDTYKDVQEYTVMNGKPSIGLVIQKQSNANTVKVSNRIDRELAQIQKELPAGIEFGTVMDQADFIQRSVNQVANNAVSGALLAVAVLYLFLHNLRSTLIIGISIPFSIITTFVLVYFAKLTLNLMSLGGLALGVGMLVDNSIVVLESIFRHRKEGEGRIEAAIAGSQEVAMAVTASTLTTIVVFLPIVFVQGLAAQLFKELALTVTFSLLASLAVALTLIPMLSSRLLKVSGVAEKPKTAIEQVFARFDAFYEKVDQKYRGLLAFSLRHRKAVVGIAAAVFAASILLFPLVGTEFIPKTDEGIINISVKMPTGALLSETGKVISRVEAAVKDIPEVDTVFSSVGSTGTMGFTGGQTDVGSVDVRLVKMSKRQRSSEEVAEEIRSRVNKIPGAEIKVEEQSYLTSFGSFGEPISIDIKGDDLEVLKDVSQKIKTIVESVAGTREVSSSLGEGRPEVAIKLKRDIAADYGLNTMLVASAVRTAVNGQVATRYRVGGEEVDVTVRLPAEDRKDLRDLGSLLITTPLGFQVPLKEVAELVQTEGPKVIDRNNQARVASVTASLAGRDLGSAVKEIQEKVKDLQLPPGITVEYGGMNKEMVDAFSNLALAFVLAVILVYMVLAAQFESLLHPFTIMFAVPLSFIGVIGGLVLTGKPLSVPAVIGIIMLAGIVVNNAIVLVDYVNTLRSRGLSRYEAILKAGPTRLRPIMMTTLTTVIGLIPLALGIGEGSEIESPLAIVVVGGLTVSTLLTLVVIPVLYTLFDDAGQWIMARFGKKKKTVLSILPDNR